jgi:hypothetical protein
LRGEEVRVTPPIQGDLRHFLAAQHLAQLGVRGFHLRRPLGNYHRLTLLVQLQRNVQHQRAVDVDGQARFAVGLKSIDRDIHLVFADGQDRKRECAILIRRRAQLRASV